MKFRRLLTAVVAAGAAMALMTLGSVAHASTHNPTYLVDNEFGSASSAAAYNVSATGLVKVLPTKSVSCNSDKTYANVSQPLLNLGSLGYASGLNDVCDYSNGDFAYSAQAVAFAWLLGGRIILTGIESDCEAFDGTGTVGSTVGFLNGQPLSSGTGQVLNIPGLATVFINENHEVGNKMWSDGVDVNILPVFVNGKQVTPAQQIVIGQCSITHLT
jgi:hypothetical protein